MAAAMDNAAMDDDIFFISFLPTPSSRHPAQATPDHAVFLALIPA
jgi:hypothetical protein